MLRHPPRSNHTSARRRARRPDAGARPSARRLLATLASLSLLAVTSTGCAKAMSESAAPTSYAGDAMAGAPEDPGFDGELMIEEVEAEPSELEFGAERAVLANRASSPEPAKDKSSTRARRDEAMKAGKRRAKAKADEGEGEDEQPEEISRQVIYTGNMQVSVFKVDKAMKRAERMTIAAGGYVQQMAEGMLILRIPAPQLRSLMEGFAEFGVVEARNLQARDVTEEYFDLRTRIRVLQETQDQLIALLKRAHNVEEALKVRQALDRVTMELEQATGRLRLLQNQIGFSTLTLNFIERGPHTDTPSSNDPFTWVNNLGVEATEWK